MTVILGGISRLNLNSLEFIVAVLGLPLFEDL